MDQSPHGKNLRKGRHSEPGRPYVITFVTKDREPLLRELAACRVVIRALMDEPRVETLAFVLMPDHVHWLIRITARVGLEDVVGAVKGSSARRVNQVLGRTGKLWQSGYHDHGLRKEGDIVGVARYIVANPLRAGLVSRVGDYPHWDAAWL